MLLAGRSQIPISDAGKFEAVWSASITKNDAIRALMGKKYLLIGNAIDARTPQHQFYSLWTLKFTVILFARIVCEKDRESPTARLPTNYSHFLSSMTQPHTTRSRGHDLLGLPWKLDGTTAHELSLYDTS